jgi:hypothetical protein
MDEASGVKLFRVKQVLLYSKVNKYLEYLW